MSRWFLLLLCSSFAQGAALPKLLKGVEAKYRKAVTLTAEFSQTIESKTTKVKRLSSGLLWISRPSKIRWETRHPDPNQLVSNGKLFWFYTPPFDEEEPGQVIIRSANKVKSQLANSLLIGEFSKSAKTIKIKSLGKNRFRLSPKKGTAGDVKTAEIRVQSKSRVIDQITLSHYGGNKTTIQLKKIKLGESFKKGFFDFKIPPKTEVIRP